MRVRTKLVGDPRCAVSSRSLSVRFAELRIRPGESAVRITSFVDLGLPAQSLNAVRKSDKLRYKLEDPVKSYA